MGLETAVITAVAGSKLLGARSALQQGATQAAAGRFNQQIAERNAKVLERQQDQIDRSTAIDIARFRKTSIACKALRLKHLDTTDGLLQVEHHCRFY